MNKNNKKSEMRKALEDEFKHVEFPVSGKMSLASDLPSGPGTTFETDHISVSAMELATKAGSDLDFPYEDIEDLLDDSIGALEDEGFFEEDDYME
jgi:hypothetical protein